MNENYKNEQILTTANDIPAEEPKRQYYFIEKLKETVKAKALDGL